MVKLSDILFEYNTLEQHFINNNFYVMFEDMLTSGFFDIEKVHKIIKWLEEKNYTPSKYESNFLFSRILTNLESLATKLPTEE